jgi:hypothetical protein
MGVTLSGKIVSTTTPYLIKAVCPLLKGLFSDLGITQFPILMGHIFVSEAVNCGA